MEKSRKWEIDAIDSLLGEFGDIGSIVLAGLSTGNVKRLLANALTKTVSYM